MWEIALPTPLRIDAPAAIPMTRSMSVRSGSCSVEHELHIVSLARIVSTDRLECVVCQGKGLMTTYWLQGVHQKREDDDDQNKLNFANQMFWSTESMDRSWHLANANSSTKFFTNPKLEILFCNVLKWFIIVHFPCNFPKSQLSVIVITMTV